MIDLAIVSRYTSVIGFTIGFPTVMATYYQAYKARQEARRERDGTLHSLNCLEFIDGDGSCINLVPLETLHSLPKAGDVVLLPGDGVMGEGKNLTGAYLVQSIEHIYTRAEYRGCRPQEARLTKAVAQVTSLNPALLAP
jgi:hypothetical protein